MKSIFEMLFSFIVYFLFYLIPFYILFKVSRKVKKPLNVSAEVAFMVTVVHFTVKLMIWGDYMEDKFKNSCVWIGLIAFALTSMALRFFGGVKSIPVNLQLVISTLFPFIILFIFKREKKKMNQYQIKLANIFIIFFFFIFIAADIVIILNTSYQESWINLQTYFVDIILAIFLLFGLIIFIYVFINKDKLKR